MQKKLGTGLLNVTATLFTLLGLMALDGADCSAQGFRWPEEPENLKVLPKEVRGAQLGQVMRGFATALGARCEHCHVGEGSDLSKFDFASDQKLAKRKARVMIQMVQAINQNHFAEITTLEDSPQKRVEVTCMTCHRTLTKPLMLDGILDQTIETDGTEAAIAKYRELREKYYGSFAYDFSAGTLTGLGERLGTNGSFDAALRILDLELEMNGESASIYYTLGGIQASAGRHEEAITSYERGLELAQENFKPFFQKEIERLRNP